LKNQKVIVALSFGKGTETNVGIAREVEKLYSQEICQIIAQQEVADFLELNKIPHLTIPEEEGKHLDTYMALKKALELVRKNFGIRGEFLRAYIIARKGHLKRAKAVARNLNFLVLDYEMPSLPYSQGDKQLWTRNAFFFWPREILIWLWYIINGNVSIIDTFPDKFFSDKKGVL
jgi:hypothetical protein